MSEPKKPAEKDVCPECGADLTDRNPWAHALDHWPAVLDPVKSSKEARERQAQLIKLAEKRGDL